MPDELSAYQDQIGLKLDQTDYSKAIRDRLKAVRELFRLAGISRAKTVSTRSPRWAPIPGVNTVRPQ